MRPPRFWISVLLLVIGTGTLWLLTEVPTESGDPVVCKWCWIGGHHHHASEGRNPSARLKTLSSAQADFRANNRNGDGVKKFWRADVAGLYALAPGGGPAIKLIELSVASADDRPVTDIHKYAVSSSKSGFWYRAIRHADETTLSPDRFAACAFPDNPSSGRFTYIIDENNTILRKELGPKERGVELFPVDPLQEGWKKLD